MVILFAVLGSVDIFADGQDTGTVNRKMMMRDPEEDTLLMTGWGEIPRPFLQNEGEFTNGNRTEYIHRYFV